MVTENLILFYHSLSAEEKRLLPEPISQTGLYLYDWLNLTGRHKLYRRNIENSATLCKIIIQTNCTIELVLFGTHLHVLNGVCTSMKTIMSLLCFSQTAVCHKDDQNPSNKISNFPSFEVFYTLNFNQNSRIKSYKVFFRHYLS